MPRDALEIQQDEALQRRIWAFQRIGRGMAFLLVVAALLGAFGRGWLAKAQVGDPNAGVWMEYERIIRYHAPTELRVHLPPQREPDGKLRLLFARAYLQRMAIDRVTPLPLRVEAQGAELLYEFAIQPRAEPVAVVFSVQPEKYGTLRGTVRVDNRDSQQRLVFRQFVLP